MMARVYRKSTWLRWLVWLWRDYMPVVWRGLAWAMPRTLVYWCAVRLGTHATTGQYSETVVPELTFMDAVTRWDVPYHYTSRSKQWN